MKENKKKQVPVPFPTKLMSCKRISLKICLLSYSVSEILSLKVQANLL